MSADLDALDRALAVLRAGGLVAFPTETVYGLGADARNEIAVRRIFRVKGRPADHPVIVHIGHAAEIDEWASDVPDAARVLAAAFWPGPLTIVVNKAVHVLDAVTGGRPSVGLRVPAHPLTLDLLNRFGRGVAAPSANRFGRVSPTTAAHVIADLDGDVDVVLDGGPCAIGVESTIVDLTAEPVVLRAGGVPLERLSSVLGVSLKLDDRGPSRAPGMLASHYAPTCRVEIGASHEARERLEALAGPGITARLIDASDADRLAPNLYAELRAADADGVDVLLAVLPDERGLGSAVADRLRKAAAPREQDDRP